jgi:plasmid stabilization system protein ParE
MKLRFTLRAVENLADIADYIHARNPSAARRVRAVKSDLIPTCRQIPAGRGRAQGV